MKEMYRYRTGMEGKSLENRKEDTEDKDITQTGKHRNSHTLNKQDHDIFLKSSRSSNLKVEKYKNAVCTIPFCIQHVLKVESGSHESGM